jgi:hypothetical protein
MWSAPGANVGTLLEKLGLARYSGVFERHEILLSAFLISPNRCWKTLPLGPEKLLAAISSWVGVDQLPAQTKSIIELQQADDDHRHLLISLIRPSSWGAWTRRMADHAEISEIVWGD